MKEHDALFWDRMMDMPAWEAEQELVLRQQRLTEENRELLLEHKWKGDAAGVKIEANNLLLGLINERIKYLRRLMDRTHWRKAVVSVFGQDGFDECAAWIEREYGHIDQRRREWSQKGARS